ncbi:MAG: ankyrin repeat domain-containing protein, partial [Alphaproteobacteria bacterium]|nr:ankyrin repeat domain-containing protein [Alphaproteobacteria bacterium]
MKFIRFLLFLGFFMPVVSFAASDSGFQSASQLLTAARRGDTRTVQILINNGADVNYVDSTGLSLVCTAVMNNDARAIQILQMYGADASQCDRQIKNYKQKTRVAARGEEYGFFSGLSSSHILALSAVGVAAIIGGVALLTDAFDAKNSNYNPSSGGSHSSSGGGGGGNTSSLTKLFAQDLPYGPACSGSGCPSDYTTWQDSNDFSYMSNNTTQDTFNYLMVAHAYNAFVRGYLGMVTVRLASNLVPFDLSSLPFAEGSIPGGGKPVNVTLVTGSGVNATGS